MSNPMRRAITALIVEEWLQLQIDNMEDNCREDPDRDPPFSPLTAQEKEDIRQSRLEELFESYDMRLEAWQEIFDNALMHDEVNRRLEALR